MRKINKLIITLAIASTSLSGFSVSLCENPAVPGGYTKSPNCVAGIPSTETNVPYVAILEATVDQSDASGIFNSHVRYIDMPVGKPFN
jgi:hypothetical protein